MRNKCQTSVLAGACFLTMCVSALAHHGSAMYVKKAIVLKDAKNKEAARAFLEFVKSAAGRATLAKYGFEFPEKTKKEEKR